jgi:hypothetical protein
VTEKPPDPRIHLFQPPKAETDEDATMVEVLRWICPHCKASNPYAEEMNDEVVICLSCTKLARPHTDPTKPPQTVAEVEKLRRLLEW